MPEGNEIHRFAQHHASAFAGGRVSVDSPNGAFPDDEVHYVYRRHGKPCFRCGTKIKKDDLSGRTIYWCPSCQKS